MNLRIWTSITVLTVCAMSFGCGGGPVDTKIAVPPTAIVASARATLEEFEKTGQKGSALSALETEINGIKSFDNAKGEALSKLYVELEAAPTPEKVKATAAKMLKVL